MSDSAELALGGCSKPGRRRPMNASGGHRMSFRSRVASATALALVGAASFLTLGLAAPAHAAAADLSFVGSASTAGNRSSHTAVVPAAVKAGDTLVLALTTN